VNLDPSGDWFGSWPISCYQAEVNFKTLWIEVAN
jgi:hypothetical protein